MLLFFKGQQGVLLLLLLLQSEPWGWWRGVSATLHARLMQPSKGWTRHGIQLAGAAAQGWALDAGIRSRRRKEEGGGVYRSLWRLLQGLRGCRVEGRMGRQEEVWVSSEPGPFRGSSRAIWGFLIPPRNPECRGPTETRSTPHHFPWLLVSRFIHLASTTQPIAMSSSI